MTVVMMMILYVYFDTYLRLMIRFHRHMKWQLPILRLRIGKAMCSAGVLWLTLKAYGQKTVLMWVKFQI